MAIYEKEDQKVSNSYKKEIEASAMPMIYDILQSFQYTKPIPSCIRETVLNAVDSVKERNIARDIISGISVVSDYYLQELDGEVYESSKFKPEYFDLKHLSANNTVTITYKNNPDLTGRDSIHIKDYGVGLGGSRLEGFMSLSYSTKRASKAFAGKWGLGAKSPLATGIESFRIVSVYNGYKFTFDIFLDSIQSITGRFGNNGINREFEFSNGYKYYGEKTQELNGLEIIIPVKKHCKREYFDAIKSQLLYVPEDIVFFEESNASKDRIKFKSDIIAKSDDLVIADQNMYSYPHIIINGTCYGYIDFKELEISGRSAPIGVVVTADDVDVSPSRESVLWTPKTKETILKKYQRIERFAKNAILAEIKGLGLFDAFNKLNDIYDKGKDKKLFKLSRLIKREDIEIITESGTYKYTPTITHILAGLVVPKYSYITSTYSNCSCVYYVEHSEAAYISDYKYFKRSGPYNQSNIGYIAEKCRYADFSPNCRYKELNEVISEYLDGNITYESLENSFKEYKVTDDWIKNYNKRRKNNLASRAQEDRILENYIKNLPILKDVFALPDIYDVKVPANYKSSYNIKEEPIKQKKVGIPYYQILSSGKTYSYSIDPENIERSNAYYYLKGEESKAAIAKDFASVFGFTLGRISKSNIKHFTENRHFSKIFNGKANIELDQGTVDGNLVDTLTDRMKSIAIEMGVLSNKYKTENTKAYKFVQDYEAGRIKSEDLKVIGISEIEITKPSKQLAIKVKYLKEFWANYKNFLGIFRWNDVSAKEKQLYNELINNLKNELYSKCQEQ